MKIEQYKWQEKTGWEKTSESDGALKNASLIIVFGDTDLLTTRKEALSELAKKFPAIPMIGCSSGANILGDNVIENSIIATVIAFEHAQVKTDTIHIEDVSNSKKAGEELVQKFPLAGLKHLFVLSDALKVDGTKLVEGMVEHLPPHVSMTGGLASDGERLQKTVILHNETVEERSAVAVAFYGESLSIRYACEAGWTPYGPLRVATKTKDNVLYELDGQPALKLYKDFLGPFADRLPKVGLLYPLAVYIEGDRKPLARTIVAVNEEDQSITYAGGMQTGTNVQFMMTNVGKLIQGAENSATDSKGEHKPELALLLSCFARKQVLRQRTEEEIEVVRNIFGPNVLFSGFYTYGEISPVGVNDKCYLQNQTMAITTIFEK